MFRIIGDKGLPAIVLVLVTCLVLFAMPQAGNAYTVSGKVTYWFGGGGPVANFSIQLVDQTAGGTMANFTNLNNGNYTATMPGFHGGSTMRVRAIVPGTGTTTHSGSVTYTATGLGDTGVNIVVSPVIWWPQAVIVSQGPVAYPVPGTQDENACYASGDEEGNPPIESNAIIVQMSYEPAIMQPIDILPVPPFNIGFTSSIGAETFTVEAQAPDFVWIGEPGNPTPLFNVIWEVNEFARSGTYTYVTVDSCVIATPSGPQYLCLSQTRYLIGEETTIPTLSEWAMIIFAVVIMGLMTYVVVRRRRRIQPTTA